MVAMSNRKALIEFICHHGSLGSVVDLVIVASKLDDTQTELALSELKKLEAHWALSDAVATGLGLPVEGGEDASI